MIDYVGSKTNNSNDAFVNQHNNKYCPKNISNTEDNELIEKHIEKPTVSSKRPVYKKKKYWIICSILTVIFIIVIVLLALFVFFPKIAQSLMNQSKIDVTYSQKRNDNNNINTAFYMHMESSLSNTGPFSVNIKFHNPIEVLYKDQLLGDIYIFNNTHVSGGHGTLNAITPFFIKNESAFTSFAKDMLAVKEFKWTLRGKLDITALTRTATVNLEKEIVLNGMNGFPDVKINSFLLPRNAPEGGILVELDTVLTSPSPIGVQLGTISLALGYDGINLGNVQATNVNLQKGDNNIFLKGTLIPHNDTESLDKIGVLFSNYISGRISNTSATGISAAPDGVNSVGWLSEGFQTVRLNIALRATKPLNIINTIDMGYLDLKFDSANPYSPMAIAPNVTAGYQIPFGFSLNITEVTQNISLAVNTSSTESTEFAIISIPYVPTTNNQEAGTLRFAIENNPIAGIPGKESIFNQYTYALTTSKNYTFMISGNVSIKTNTPVGPINLEGITFFLPTSLYGLQFLNSTATIINSIDVTGGTIDKLVLSINVTMMNPSDFNISIGNISFIMGAEDAALGLVVLDNLSLTRGQNTVIATATLDSKSTNIGQNLLNSFIMGNNNAIKILGHSNSTNIASLVNPLSDINIGSTLPGLKESLIKSGALTILSDTVITGIAGVKVSIANPFSADLSISKVTAAATFKGMPIGKIDQDISSNTFIVPGKGTAESQYLSMNMNIEPASIALLLRTLAIEANLDNRALDALLGLGDFQIVGQETIVADSSLFSDFNISSYVIDAMKALKVDISLFSNIQIGEYLDELVLSQSGVAISTDNSITQLIPLVGQPIVQQIVDGSVLAFKTIVLSSPTNDNFIVRMRGSITNTGPMDAIISFPTSLKVFWQGEILGTVTMPDIHTKADFGASFDVKGKFSIANTDDMSRFAAYLINNDDFIWDITCEDVNVNALGFTFSKIKMDKSISLTGANGYKNAVTINSFDLPSNDPNGGITLLAETTIENPSQIGFDLSCVAFETFYKDVNLGPLASDGVAVFPAKGIASISMKGRLIPQNSLDSITAVTEVFENYLNAKDSLLDVKGVSASGPDGQVKWLSSAFQTLVIENVILPGPKSKPELIPAITLKDMSLDFTKDFWAPSASSNNVQAQLKNPFGFPLSVNKLDMNVVANYNGQEVASLKVPTEKATTSSTGLVITQFSNIPFKVIDKTAFARFVQLLTMKQSTTFGLRGISDAVAQTGIGKLNLRNIEFDVSTKLDGFNNFGGKITILSIDVIDGTPEYTLINLKFSLYNPSNITITLGDINFDVIMNECNAVVGQVYVKDTVIPPGSKIFNAQMHLGENSTNDKTIGQLFSNFLTSAITPLTIAGSSDSTAIVPLQSALSSVKLSTELDGIAANLISHVAVKGSIIGLIIKKEAESVITLQNPLNVPFSIKSIQASVVFHPSSGASSFTVGTIDYNLTSLSTVPAKDSATTNEWPVAIIGSGVEHFMQLIELLLDPNKYFDVEQNITVIVGNNGYETQMYYYQNKVPFSIQIDNLPPIVITTNSLSNLSLPSNITSITDQNVLEQMVKNILAGNVNESASKAGSTITTSSTF
ncbi:uncharacterized protein BX663DRAFT_438815 [Cokeromyces recurvatus]|uniref:uncharacterized protein n=1 Tax=Cokeromyces recurvatus TaxID=90255 RepID=UPI0022206C1E|nr:uncharacterized protein BX663DRAFT_438815 [Cokeromyces recurvatus]KAI7900771.1 hypothetical protein BX663DRAFT_438815 [Cokeromyces recurvatus]